MFDFTDEQKMVRTVVRKWVLANLSPAVDRLEAEETLPYDLMRSFIKTFGIDEMARAGVSKRGREVAQCASAHSCASARSTAITPSMPMISREPTATLVKVKYCCEYS